MTVSDPYQILLDQLKYPKSNRLRAIFEYLIPQGRAQITASLPGTAEEVAQKTGFEVDTVKQALEDLFFAGLVFPNALTTAHLMPLK